MAETLECVQIDGQVVLKIINAAKDNKEPTGSLFGLPRGRRVEITNCIPLPPSISPEEVEYFQEESLRLSEEIRQDALNVGWFCVTADFFTDEFIGHMYDNQSDSPSYITVVMEPYRRNSGNLDVRALRLTDAFMKQFAVDTNLTGVLGYNIRSEDIFEYLPIQIHNSHLVHAFLYELREAKITSTDHIRLGIQVNASEQFLDNLSMCLHLYSQEQQKFHHHERTLAKNEQEQKKWIQKREADNQQRAKQGKPPLPDDRSKQPCFKETPKPSRLDSLLIANRMFQVSKYLEDDAAVVGSKMYVVDALNR
jgi:translation initiation factor 3 subunit H